EVGASRTERVCSVVYRSRILNSGDISAKTLEASSIDEACMARREATDQVVEREARRGSRYRLRRRCRMPSFEQVEPHERAKIANRECGWPGLFSPRWIVGVDRSARVLREEIV